MSENNNNAQPADLAMPGVVAKKQAAGQVNEASSKFKDADGAVIDATPEGEVKPNPTIYEERPPLNPYTKGYKATFPYRDQDDQNAAATTDGK